MKFKNLGLAFMVLALAIALGVQGTVNVARADPPPPNCIRVLASFFGPIDGLKDEIAITRAVAEEAGVPLGQVIRNLTGRTGDVDACLGFLFGGG